MKFARFALRSNSRLCSVIVAWNLPRMKLRDDRFFLSVIRRVSTSKSLLKAFNNGIRCEKLKNCFVHPDRGKADAVEASVGKKCDQSDKERRCF